MSVETTLWDDLLQGEELAYLGSEAAREARTAALPDDLPAALRERLEARGIDSLYSHQAEAWETARRGKHFVVTTGTASGKSLAFNLPVLAALAEEPKLRALYLYPTKALAQDQVRALDELQVKRVRPAIYDGDTESERRWQIRKWSNLILTNPDMLHVGVLPHHDRWGDVLSNLRFVVVDEAHVYRGVFGSHVGNVLRRLRRLARVYGSEPAVPARLGDDRQPGRARDLADRARLHRHRRRRRTESRAHDRALEPRADRRGARSARQRPRRRLEAHGRPRRARAAHARLRQEPRAPPS